MITTVFQILCPIPGCFAILFLRYLLERFVFIPIGLWFGIRNHNPKKAPVNAALEKEFPQLKDWSPHRILALSEQLDIPEERIEELLGIKSAEVKTTVLKKFCDSAWNLFYYSSETIFGFIVLWDKSWLWDLKDCWKTHSVTNDEVWLYFMLYSSFAWSQLISLTFEVKRKDFYLRIVHHVGFISLLSFARVYNFFQCLSVAVFLCDSNDVFLEVSKITKYLGFEKIAVFTYIVFTFWWIIVRVVLHPFWLTRSVILDAPKIRPDFSHLPYYIISSISILFVIINLFWTFFVLKAAIHIFLTGRGEDPRSDTEE